ncbi:hypothetical protein CBER1_11357 [Cercospora berteroae]|uniref:Uncharacterized protein n=1 Tax=Cercospora berteroae TaxID=357750 RepID=A0A2S6BZ03_9PEZI|nr:hypothetical protein CBER1_11357 [Cercospora berteroae]
MAPISQLPSLGGVLGGAAAPAPAASIVGAAPSLAAPAAISNAVGAVPVAAALPTNVAVPSANGLPNVAIPTGSILSAIFGRRSFGPAAPNDSLTTKPPAVVTPNERPVFAPIWRTVVLATQRAHLGLAIEHLGDSSYRSARQPPTFGTANLQPRSANCLPIIPLEAISPVQAILATLGESLISKLTDQLTTIIATITGAVANVPVADNPTAILAGLSRHSMNNEETEKSKEKRQLPSVPGSEAVGGAVNTITNLLGGVTGGLSGGAAGGSPLTQLGALTGVTSALTGGVLANSNPLSFLTGGALKPITDGSLIPVGSVVGGLTGNSGGNILSGVQSSLGSAVSNGLGLAGNAGSPLAGVQNTVQGAVSGLTGGAAAGNPLGDLTSGLSLSGGPLSSVTGVLGNLGLGSIVLKVVSLQRIPAYSSRTVQLTISGLASPCPSEPSRHRHIPHVDGYHLSCFPPHQPPTGQLSQLQSSLSLLNLFSSLNIASLGPLRDLTNIPSIQSAASQINTQDLLTTLSLLKTPSFLPTNLASPEALLSNPTELLSTIQKLSTQVQQPSPAAAFLLLQQINAGGLGDLVSALPSAAPAAPGSPAAPAAPAVPSVPALPNLGALNGAAPASANANVGANGNAATTVGRGRMMKNEMMENEMMDEEEVAEE